MVRFWWKYEICGGGKLRNKNNALVMPSAELTVFTIRKEEREREREREIIK
jgi:hypothetical protein